MPKIVTHKDYVDKVFKINPNIEVLETYINAKTKILHRCKVNNCKYEWITTPNRILCGAGCPRCNGVERYTTESYIDSVFNINKNIIVIDEYQGVHTPILHKCRVCDHEWMVVPASILNAHTGCPVCSGNVIGKAPEYRNSIWSNMECRNLFKDYLTEEQMKTNMPNSVAKIDMKCPVCSRHKKYSPHQFYKRGGLGCVCSDGVSYPNKLVSSLLEQINIDFVREYHAEWSGKKLYDFYIPSINTIIECHGIQHYFGWGYNTDDFIRQQNNDSYKMNLALNNGIENYIVIDCRESNIDFIKTNIEDSKLLELLSVSTLDIDWEECGKFASGNLIVDVSKMWDAGLSLKEIRERIKISNGTVTKYIKIGNRIGICKCMYSPEESRRRAERPLPSNTTPVYCIDLNKVYQSQNEAGRELLKKSGSKIGACCKGKIKTAYGYRWYYLYDQILNDGTIISGAITLGLITEEEALRQLNDVENMN